MLVCARERKDFHGVAVHLFVEGVERRRTIESDRQQAILALECNRFEKVGKTSFVEVTSSPLLLYPGDDVVEHGPVAERRG